MASSPDTFVDNHKPFLDYLLNWLESLPPVALADLTSDPSRVGVASIDLIKGFTTTGRLASPRIAAIVPNVVQLFTRAHEMGVRDFVLLQDSHPEDSIQFETYGSHATKGSVESEMTDELARLPFASEFVVLPKETVSAAVGTGLDHWLYQRRHLRTVVVVGDCTDICVYQLAMHLRTRSVVERWCLDVILPENCVQTYDVSVGAAARLGATPHDGDLLHLIFLYHMALNGIRVVSGVL